MKLLSPVPKNSLVVVDKKNLFTIDWLRWFQELAEYLSRVLNRYHTDYSGAATLVAGTVTVANTKVSSISYIRLTAQNEGSNNIGNVYIFSKTPGTGFVIKSSNASDTRQIFYEIVEVF